MRKGPQPAVSSVEGIAVLRWALICLIVALVAALLGFGGVAGAAAGVAKVLFFVFLLLFVIGLMMHLVRGRPVV